MNIFFSSTNPISAAFNLNHFQLRKKMVVECFQLLCTTHVVKGFEAPYKAFNPQHESRVWVGESLANYRWLLRHALAIIIVLQDYHDFTQSYAKQDSEYMINFLYDNESKLNLPDVGLTLPFLAMKNHSPDLVAKYGNQEGIVSPKTGKTNVAYRAKSFHEAIAAYKQFLQRKDYWQPEYTFIK